MVTSAKAGESDPWPLDATQKEAWVSLMAIVNRALPEMERLFREHDMLGVHYHIFVELSAAPERTLQLSELANRANLSQSRLTHRLRVLVERGDVAIECDTDDRRVKHATLTDAGFARLAALAPLHAEDVRRLIFCLLYTSPSPRDA